MTKVPHTAQHRLARIEHGRRTRTLGGVVHDAEASNLIGVRNYFATSSPDAVGAHLGDGLDGSVEQWADLDAICWHCPGANSTCWGDELMGFSSQPRWRWLRRRRQLRAAANRQAWGCWHYKLGLPRRGRNTWGHGDFPPPNTHTDPGRNFPWPAFMRLCRRAYRKLVRTNGRHWL